MVWLAGMSGVLFLILLSSSSYVASLPFIREEWNLTNTQSGVVFSSYLAGYAASSLLLVPFTDRFNPFHILLIGVVLTAASGILFPIMAEGIWTACILRFVYGVGHVCVYITGIRMASNRFADRGRGTAVSVFVGSDTLARRFRTCSWGYSWTGWKVGRRLTLLQPCRESRVYWSWQYWGMDEAPGIRR